MTQHMGTPSMGTDARKRTLASLLLTASALVLGSIADPFVALFAPVTPGFLVPPLKPFFAAFCLYFLKMMLFGIGAAPPPWVFLLIALS